MRKIIKLLLTVIAFTFTTITFAQSDDGNLTVLTKIDNSVNYSSKALNKAAKNFAKDEEKRLVELGWRNMSGKTDMKVMLENYYKYSFEVENGNPKYYFVEAIETAHPSNRLDMEIRKASNKARQLIADKKSSKTENNEGATKATTSTVMNGDECFMVVNLKHSEDNGKVKILVVFAAKNQ